MYKWQKVLLYRGNFFFFSLLYRVPLKYPMANCSPGKIRQPDTYPMPEISDYPEVVTVGESMVAKKTGNEYDLNPVKRT